MKEEKEKAFDEYILRQYDDTERACVESMIQYRHLDKAPFDAGFKAGVKAERERVKAKLEEFYKRYGHSWADDYSSDELFPDEQEGER